MSLFIEIYTEEIPAGYMSDLLRFGKKFFRKEFRSKVNVIGTSRRIIIYDNNLIVDKERVSKVLKNFVETVPVKKRMRWDDSGLTFPRPIRHLLVFIDDVVLSDVDFWGVPCGGEVYFLRGNCLLIDRRQINSPAEYFDFLTKIGVILDWEKRRDFIRGELEAMAKKVDCFVSVEEDLLDEVNFLTEAPVVFLGRLKEKFLELPREVLATSMGRNQKLFMVLKENNSIAPFFLGVLEGEDRKSFDYTLIVRRVESVLEARLSDAYFFWQQDCKVDLRDRVNMLDNVIVHTKIGTLLDKIEKMRVLWDVLKPDLSIDEEDFEDLKLATYLSKADLETMMVYEFPELEGIMGYYYALKQGYPEAVAVAIKDHYSPRNAEDRLPTTKLGRLLAVMERVNSITTYFGVGLKPTGNEDPYGVRRSVLTLIKLVLLMPEPINLDRFFCESVKLWGYPAELVNEIELYFCDRVIKFLVYKGLRQDIVKAVYSRFGLDLQRVSYISKELNSISKTQDFLHVLKILERTHKITKKALQNLEECVNVDLFVEGEEKELWKCFLEVEGKFKSFLEEKDIKSAVKVYANLYDPLHKFFDKVMVNVEDIELRNNRLAMLRCINKLFSDNIAVFY